jgi:hypothetical protein
MCEFLRTDHILTTRIPPCSRVPPSITIEEAVRVGSATLTIGEERFAEAEALLRAGKSAEAARAFEQLRTEYPNTWIDREATKRLSAVKRMP